jgi:hypothetical protein
MASHARPFIDGGTHLAPGCNRRFALSLVESPRTGDDAGNVSRQPGMPANTTPKHACDLSPERLPVAIEPNIDALAQRLGIEGAPLSAQMQVTYLAPDIVKAFMDETRRPMSRGTSPRDARTLAMDVAQSQKSQRPSA